MYKYAKRLFESKNKELISRFLVNEEPLTKLIKELKIIEAEQVAPEARQNAAADAEESHTAKLLEDISEQELAALEGISAQELAGLTIEVAVGQMSEKFPALTGPTRESIECGGLQKAEEPSKADTDERSSPAKLNNNEQLEATRRKVLERLLARANQEKEKVVAEFVERKRGEIRKIRNRREHLIDDFIEPYLPPLDPYGHADWRSDPEELSPGEVTKTGTFQKLSECFGTVHDAGILDAVARTLLVAANEELRKWDAAYPMIRAIVTILRESKVYDPAVDDLKLLRDGARGRIFITDAARGRREVIGT